MDAVLSVAALAQQQLPGIGDLASSAVGAFGFLLALHLVQVLFFLALLRLLDWYEREPISILAGMFLWGGTVAVLFSLVFNAWGSMRLSPEMDAVFGAAITAPIFEEISKTAALVLAFALSIWASKRYGTFEFGGVTDGIVYGAAVGLGFAFFENAQYFANFAGQYGVREGTEVFLMRVNFLGVTSSLLGHGAYTGLAGAGLGLAAWTNNWNRRILYAGGGLALGIFAHAWWNGITSFILVRQYGLDEVARAFSGQQTVITQAAYDAAVAWQGGIKWIVGAILLGAAIWWLRHEGQIIRYELAEEVNEGRLPREEYDLLTAFRARTKWYLAWAKGGHFEVARALKRSHDELVELAMQKWRIRKLGGDQATIERKRTEIAALREYAHKLAAATHATAPDPQIAASVAGTAQAESGTA